jgi:predicted RNase H-like HicB family nuclease
VKEAIELQVREMPKDGEPLPAEGGFIVAHADVDVKERIGP